MKYLRIITVVSGSGAMLYGLWEVYHPLAFILGGSGVLYLGFLIDTVSHPEGPE